MNRSEFQLLTGAEQDIYIGEYLCAKGKYGIDFTDAAQDAAFFRWLLIACV